MNRSSAAKSVGKIDRLLDGLADLATRPDTSTEQFCSRSVQVTESLLDLHWAAVVADAGDASGTKAPLLVAGGDIAAKQLGQLNQRFPKIANQSSQTGWLETLERSPRIGFAPISLRNQTWGWLIAAKQNTTPIKGFETEVLIGIGEIATEHLKTKSQQRDQEQIQYQNRLDAFKLNAHASLAVQRSSKQITNDVRWLCGCERATLVSLSGRRRRSKVLSVSSIATVDRNSDFTKHMQAMVSLAARDGSLLSSDAIAGQTENTKLQTRVLQWTQASGFGFLFGIPLIDRIDNKPIGYLVLEGDTEIDRAGFAATLRQVQPHVAVAMANATRFESLPFRRSLSLFRRFVRVNNFIKLVAAVGMIAALIVALFTLQRPFSVRAAGELLPQIEQTVSAQVDGNMATVEVEHGQTVVAGQRLATIHSPDLISEIESIDGEYAKTRQLIESKKILMGQYGHAGDPALVGRLAAEVSDLKFQLELLQARQTFLNEKHQQLNVVAPRRGQIITWRPQANLLGKPVRWGDPLFQIADLDGNWEVVLQVPEQRIGYVWDKIGKADTNGEFQSDNSGTELSVNFFLKSNPNQLYQSSVTEIARSVEIDPDLGALTTIRCRVPEELKHCRHGASVVADIDCGNRSLAFVCFGEFWDSLRRSWVR